jgi:NAD(P)-dependent dehydrogenase (short-subunit alcohol dehydrogenase family)
MMTGNGSTTRRSSSEIEAPQQFYAPGLLKGKVAFITGGATGIGLGIARPYVRLGANVVIASRNQANLCQTERLLTGEKGGEAVAFRTDVRDYDEVRNSIGECVKHFGALDILVDNAAGNFACPTAKLTPNGWRTVVDIDLNGTFYCCHAAYEALKQSAGGGCIITIGATRGFTGWSNQAHAAAAKAGITSLMRTLAVE